MCRKIPERMFCSTAYSCKLASRAWQNFCKASLAHKNVIASRYTIVVSRFESFLVFATNSCLGCCPPLNVCKYIEETTLNWMSYCFARNTTACQRPFNWCLLFRHTWGSGDYKHLLYMLSSVMQSGNWLII